MIRFVPYNAADGWRWHALEPNGKIIADSGQAFDSHYSVRRSIANLIAEIRKMEVPEEFIHATEAEEGKEPQGQERQRRSGDAGHAARLEADQDS